MNKTIRERVLESLKKAPGTPEDLGQRLGLKRRGKSQVHITYHWGSWNFIDAERTGLIEWREGKWYLTPKGERELDRIPGGPGP